MRRAPITQEAKKQKRTSANKAGSKDHAQARNAANANNAGGREIKQTRYAWTEATLWPRCRHSRFQCRDKHASHIKAGLVGNFLKASRTGDINFR